LIAVLLVCFIGVEWVSNDYILPWRSTISANNSRSALREEGYTHTGSSLT
jgi:hypothetical protein